VSTPRSRIICLPKRDYAAVVNGLRVVSQNTEGRATRSKRARRREPKESRRFEQARVHQGPGVDGIKAHINDETADDLFRRVVVAVEFVAGTS
jgi:hypothetical protein